jgi:hypothetical protein
MCGCNVPSQANYYVHWIIGRNVPGGTETNEIDGYYCASHVDARRKEVRRNTSGDGWRVIESRKRFIR